MPSGPYPPRRVASVNCACSGPGAHLRIRGARAGASEASSSFSKLQSRPYAYAVVYVLNSDSMVGVKDEVSLLRQTVLDQNVQGRAQRDSRPETMIKEFEQEDLSA